MLTEYLPILLFIMFDIEIIFLYPWTAIYRELEWFGFFEQRWPHYNWRFCRQGGWICRSGLSRGFRGEEG